MYIGWIKYICHIINFTLNFPSLKIDSVTVLNTMASIMFPRLMANTLRICQYITVILISSKNLTAIAVRFFCMLLFGFYTKYKSCCRDHCNYKGNRAVTCCRSCSACIGVCIIVCGILCCVVATVSCFVISFVII